MDLSVLSISAVLIRLLKVNKIMNFDELLSNIVRIKGEQARVIFTPSINFLFLVGKIEYHQELDAFELI